MAFTGNSGIGGYISANYTSGGTSAITSSYITLDYNDAFEKYTEQKAAAPPRVLDDLDWLRNRVAEVLFH